ncbi:hypothetical protein BU23DRAFT_582135 [Bimuria novae-zelandiae CBS 107.79]|uniref:Acyl-CoA desaturase n=1 Tax=Bimuria novae-zelandiae CBS 107.79 TaxID=1447943 RepID=A0A6A5V178_9PLEO|nr:hypothetical protein BU23DRAFT_582135 [Bimuria novae-zelandiae CBS 107.79]
MSEQRSQPSDQPVTIQNWYKHINWSSTTLVLLVPAYGLYAAQYVPLTRATAIWGILLWSHRCYNARLPLRIFLAFVGAGAIQGSIRFWSSKHRAHHRWKDTSKDPYCALRGFFHAHLGWMVLQQDPKKIGRTDISDLDADPVVVWQHKHYGKSLMVAAWLFPMCVAGLGWSDWWGGLVYAGILRACFVQQATFCVNSLAHWLGEQPFDDRRTPRDHFITAIVTLGEGYHNFHHEFPSDYRNAISWYQYDPTKWLIYLLSKTTLAYDLKRFRHNEIEKGRLQQQQKALDARRVTLDWGLPLSQLPVVSWVEYQARCASGDAALIAITGIIHDVTDFITEHPGGKALIKGWVGKDATAGFNGGVYVHSNAAHNLLSTMRVGVLRGGQEVEVWKEERGVPGIKDKLGRVVVRVNEHVTNVRRLVGSAEAA